MSNKINLLGEVFGRLVVIDEALPSKNKSAKWLCECECGNITEVKSYHLRTGHTTSCGCYRIDKITTHKMSQSKTYNIWVGMKRRCYDKRVPNYDYYGGRGIRVCDRWVERNGFINFLEDMGECLEGMSINRIDNNGDYTPNNCLWDNDIEQNRNKSSSKWWFISGIRYDSLSDASGQLSIPISTIFGWCDGPYGSREDCWSEPKYS